MKTTVLRSFILASTIVLFFDPSSFGQGYVNFANTMATRASLDGLLQPASPVGSWYYALLVAPSTQDTLDTTTLAGWTFVALATNTAVAGRLTGNNFDNGLAVQINAGPYPAPGAFADFAVVGWSGNIGSDWNTVRAGWHGFEAAGTWSIVDPGKPGDSTNVWFVVSSVAQDVLIPPPDTPYSPIFGRESSSQIAGLNFQRVSIPEPAFFPALAAGVGIVLLIAKPRKKNQARFASGNAEI